MPTLRSSKRLHPEKDNKKNMSNENNLVVDDKKNVKVTVKKEDENHQWVMIGPNNLFSKEELNGNSDIVFCKLPHPQNGVPSLYVFKKKAVFELMKFEDDGYRSWFIDETVQKDGSLLMATPIDPLFLVLPYLEKAASLGHFTTLDIILMDQEYPVAMHKLDGCLTKDMLLNVCDCKGSDDLVVFKCNEEKLLQWLSKKVTNVSDHLMKSKINVQQGAQISNFVQCSDECKSKDDCLRYAWSVVSDYLVEKWSLKLKDHFEIKDPTKPVNPPASKRQRLSEQEPCLEDYRDQNTENNTKKANAPKLSTAQKRLNKVDKKGMKTMGSFFKTAPKK